MIEEIAAAGRRVGAGRHAGTGAQRQACIRALGRRPHGDGLHASSRATISSATSTAPGPSAPRSPPTAPSSASIPCSTTRSTGTFAPSSRTWPRTRAGSGRIGQQVGDFYASWMDEAAIEAKGAAPLKPYLDRIAAVKDKGELVDLFATVGYPSPVGVGIFPDLPNPTRYAVYAGQGGLGLPNRDYYLLQGAKYDAYRAAYRAYMTQHPAARRHPRRGRQGRPDLRARNRHRQGPLDARAQPRHRARSTIRWTWPSSTPSRRSSSGSGRWPRRASATSRR